MFQTWFGFLVEIECKLNETLFSSAAKVVAAAEGVTTAALHHIIQSSHTKASTRVIKECVLSARSTTHTYTLSFYSIPFRSVLEVRDRASELQFQPEWRCRITFLPPFMVVCGVSASDDVVVTHMVPLYCSLVVLQGRLDGCIVCLLMVMWIDL